VCIIETPQEKVVLKVPLSISHTLGEGQFLKAWEQVGVRVPHIFEEGLINGHEYSLMEYIEAPTVEEKFSNSELSEKGIYFEMGATLHKMHEAKGEGYGRFVDGKAEFASFKDYLLSENMQKRFLYVQENLLLGEEHGSLSLAYDILLEYIGDNKESSYCHYDLGLNNMFATNPITVFDPKSEFNNGYMDLGRAIVIRISHDGVFPKQMVDGYFAGKSYNEKVLQAAIMVNSCIKFYYWHQTKNTKGIKNVQEYLIKTKHLLEK
jgi:tRNA A-37 threonylcarbamoyl transferase component Bud32